METHSGHVSDETSPPTWDQIPSIHSEVTVATDWFQRRAGELAIVQVLAGYAIFAYADLNHNTPPLSQLTFVNAMISVLCAVYVRFYPRFPLGIRLYTRWGCGWEIAIPYLVACNSAIICIYYSTLSYNFSAPSVLLHLSLPCTMVFWGLTPTLVHWMARLKGFDIAQSVLTFCGFMYGNLWYHHFTAGTWPYFDNTFPNLYAVQGNAVVFFLGAAIFLLTLIYHSVCTYLSQTRAYTV
jgi:hypothetical protein